MSDESVYRPVTTAIVQPFSRTAKTAPLGVETSSCGTSPTPGTAVWARSSSSSTSPRIRSARSRESPLCAASSPLESRIAAARMSTDSSSRYSSASGGGSAVSGTGICRIPAVPLSKMAWLVTVAILVIAAILVLIAGYLGYFGVLLAVAAAAAVNLCGGPPRPWRPGSRGRLPLAARVLDVVGLEVDEHVRVGHAPLDALLELVAQEVRPLERRAGPELHVQVDVAAAAPTPRAQLVVSGHLGSAVLLDRRADLPELRIGQRLVDQHPRRAAHDPHARVDDRRRDDQRGDRVERLGARHLHEHQPHDHADRGEGVGAQMRGVALERRRIRDPRAAVQVRGDAEV